MVCVCGCFFFHLRLSFLIFFQEHGENQKQGDVCADHNDPALSGVTTNMRNKKLQLVILSHTAVNMQICIPGIFFERKEKGGRSDIDPTLFKSRGTLFPHLFFQVLYRVYTSPPDRKQASPLPCYSLQMKNTPA